MVQRPMGYWRLWGSDRRIAFVHAVVYENGIAAYVEGEILSQIIPIGSEPLTRNLRWRRSHGQGIVEAHEVKWWLDDGTTDNLLKEHGRGRLNQYLGPVLKQEWFKSSTKAKGCCCDH